MKRSYTFKKECVTLIKNIMGVSSDFVNKSVELKEMWIEDGIIDITDEYKTVYDNVPLMNVLLNTLVLGLNNTVGGSMHYGKGVVSDFDLFTNYKSDASLREMLESSGRFTEKLFEEMKNSRTNLTRLVGKTKRTIIASMELPGTPELATTIKKKTPETVQKEIDTSMKSVISSSSTKRQKLTDDETVYDMDVDEAVESVNVPGSVHETPTNDFKVVAEKDSLSDLAGSASTSTSVKKSNPIVAFDESLSELSGSVGKESNKGIPIVVDDNDDNLSDLGGSVGEVALSELTSSVRESVSGLIRTNSKFGQELILNYPDILTSGVFLYINHHTIMAASADDNEKISTFFKSIAIDEEE